MAITLSDITAATAAYIDDEVVVTVDDITNRLNPEEIGTYTVTVTNAAAPTGVRLTDVVLHLTITPGEVALLKPPGSALLVPRATNDANAPRLSTSDAVESMFIFFFDGDFALNKTLDVGEVLELELEYVAEARGNATITCHVHATVDVGDVFPRSGGSNGEGDLRVLAA